MGNILSAVRPSSPEESRTGGPHEPDPKHLSISEEGKGPLKDPDLNRRISELLQQAGNEISEQSLRRTAVRNYAVRLSKCCDEFASNITMDSNLSKESSIIASDYLLDRPPRSPLIGGTRIKHAASAARGTGWNPRSRSTGYLTFDPIEPNLYTELSVLSNMQLVRSRSVCTDKIKSISGSDYFGTSNFHSFRPTSLSPTISATSLPYMINSSKQYVSELPSELFESGGDGDVLLDEDRPVTACMISSITNTLPDRSYSQIFSSDPHRSRRDSSCLSRSHSMPSLSQITSAETCTRAGSLPDMMLESSTEEFTPDIIVDEHDETYRLQCSGSGLYQCSVTGLVFHMEGEGVVVYRIVPWNRRLLAHHHKRPAGPLFDIKCVQQSVCRLHLPHCEVRSTGGGDWLSVAHVTDEGIEFISPHQITETHVVINITEFSGYGNVTDEDSPADPVRALVLLFYRPPAGPHPTSLLNVLLLPRNVVLRNVLVFRKKLIGNEIYIETSPHCKLQPRQEYTLSTSPEDNSVLVQPTEAEFDCDNYDNYFPSFQVTLKTILVDIKLLLRDIDNSHTVWEREVCLSSTGGQRSTLNLPPRERLMDIRSSFVDSISKPVLTSLVDRLLEIKVIADPEMETVDAIRDRSDKARFVIDTVRKKGDTASSEMIEFLCDVDPFLSEHLGLI